jgi:hypothetical protein
MKRRRVFRDQGWLRDNIKKTTVDVELKKSQLEESNRWVKPGRATKDLEEAYIELSCDPSFLLSDRRAAIYHMSVWLRENRRLVPSPTSFRRFLSTKTNI